MNPSFLLWRRLQVPLLASRASVATAVSPDMMCGSARNQSKRLPRPSANPQAQKKAGRVRTLGLVHTTCCVLQYITLFVVTVFSTPKPLWVESDSTMFRGCGGAPDAKLLLISLDLEHTGWGAYNADPTLQIQHHLLRGSASLSLVRLDLSCDHFEQHSP